MNIENFERAFSLNTAGCRRQCACGKTFYHDNESDYDWEDGEFEELENSDAVALDYSVGDIGFEGREYVNACDCWHERSASIMNFIDAHSTSIAKYLNSERERRISEAEYTPVVLEG